jgi:glycosyltransferase involved in cell wall biosynthesis
VTNWHVLAPEYPPGCGGVGEYTAMIEAGLRDAGDRVRVWHPGALPDRFGPAARRTIETALRADPGTLLVQYVPAAFGLRGMNLPFCWWLRRLAREGADVRVMFHEPFFYFGIDRPWRNALALVQRLMAAILLRAARRVYYSTESWTRLLAPYGPQRHVEVLPIPSTIPADVPLDAMPHGTGEPTVGHFGTYGEHVAGQLVPALGAIVARLPGVRLRLLGRGAAHFASRLDAGVRSRTDVIEAEDGAAIARALRACDILLQPYPDGVTTRRTSMMAALASGVAVVTTAGALTEPVWRATNAVVLVPADDAAAVAAAVATLAADAPERRARGERGRRLYDDCFALPVSLARMRRA